MHQSFPRQLARALVVLAVSISFTVAHSWVEELSVINPNGTYVGALGYARGNVKRLDGDADKLMTNKIPPNGRPEGNTILDTDPICMSTQQTMTQSNGSPRLQAAAGSYVALLYQENGHVTLPGNQPGKPDNRGTVYVYGTTQSKPDDTLLAIHKKWNTAGTGGDGRGKLLATQNFDDGQCHQVNESPIAKARRPEFPPATKATSTEPDAQLWCQNDIALPSDAPSGKPYTLYWVWDWPTAPHVDPAIPTGKPELYTTCMDIDIAAKNAQKDTESAHYIQGQNLGDSGVSSYMNDLNAGKNMVATQSGQAVETGASSTATVPASSAINAQPTSSMPLAASSVAVQAPPLPTPESSTNIPATVTATSVASTSQASSAAADGVVTVYVTVSSTPTVYVTVSSTPTPSAPPYSKSTASVSPLPVAPTSSTAATYISSTPSSAASSSAASTIPNGSACGATKVQKRSRILDGATRHRFSKMKSGHVVPHGKSTTPRSVKFRHL
ncbi:MAG: hypothetical protein LQ347_001500 [Umbilicaria vellea]|nr:MAG: hypothetical protein LQ347_001500 [Umbilicaria vellea]